MQNKVLPFILSAVLSALAMVFLMFDKGDLIPGLKFGLTPVAIPGIAFVLAYVFRFGLRVSEIYNLLTVLMLLAVWLVAFALSFNALFILLVPISGAVGALGVWFIGKVRHGIHPGMKPWQIGLVGLGSATLGLAVWVTAKLLMPDIDQWFRDQFIEPVGVTSALIVLSWQIAMAFVLRDIKIIDPDAEKVEEIGVVG